MASFRFNTRTVRLFSTAADFGHIEIIASHRGVVLDVEGRHPGLFGDIRRDHAVVDLPIDAARELLDALTAAVRTAETAIVQHPGLWSDSALRAVACARKGLPA